MKVDSISREAFDAHQPSRLQHEVIFFREVAWFETEHKVLVGSVTQNVEEETDWSYSIYGHKSSGACELVAYGVEFTSADQASRALQAEMAARAFKDPDAYHPKETEGAEPARPDNVG